MLFQNVSNGLRMKLQGCTSAKDAWEKLARLHQVDDEEYRAEIRNQLSTIVMSQADDPETFVERYETLLMTAKVAKLDLFEGAKCSDFLRALPASYDNLRSEWRTISRFAKAEDEKNYEALSTLFNTHVLQLQRQKDKEQPAAMFAGRQGKQEDARECGNCGGWGHLRSRCTRPKIGGGRNHRPAVDRRKAKSVAKDESGSNMDDMMALFGEDPLVGAVTCVSDRNKEHGAVLATVQQRMDGKVLWVIDSGATDHVCNDRSAFCSIQPCASPTRYRTAGNDVPRQKRA
jgi:hypothetical protein